MCYEDSSLIFVHYVSFSSRGCSPAEPRDASNCAAKMQNFFHSSILQFDLYAEKYFLFEIKTVYLHHKKTIKIILFIL